MVKAKETQQLKPPLWKCLKCGHKFVTRNLWHSCSRYPLSHHFKDKESIVRELFDKYHEVIESFGPVTVIPQKTRIVFQVRVRFAGAVARKHWLEGALWLKRPAEHPFFFRTEKLNAHDHIYSFRLRRLADLKDGKLVALLREAYKVGCQEQTRTGA